MYSAQVTELPTALPTPESDLTTHGPSSVQSSASAESIVSRSRSYWPPVTLDGRHPATIEFGAELRKWLASETIVLENVDADASGIVDLVLVGPSGTIGIQFDHGAIDRPAPYFVDSLFLIDPLDVIDSEIELLYILMKSYGLLFSEAARLRLPRLARMDRFNFAKPKSGRTSSYEISGGSRRYAPLVLRVLAPEQGQEGAFEVNTPAAA